MTFSDLVKKQLIGTPVTPEDLTTVKKQLSYVFPSEYVEMLKIADGGLWENQRVIMYSCGDSMPMDDRLLTANLNRAGAKLFFIGRFSEDEFGYKLDGLSIDSTQIFVQDHETDELKLLAINLSDFFAKFSKPTEKKKKKWYSFLFS